MRHCSRDDLRLAGETKVSENTRGGLRLAMVTILVDTTETLVDTRQQADCDVWASKRFHSFGRVGSSQELRLQEDCFA